MSEMLDSSPESLLEILGDYDGYIYRTYGHDVISSFQKSSGLRRALLTRRYPEVALYCQYSDAQTSIVEAKKSTFRNEGFDVII